MKSSQLLFSGLLLILLTSCQLDSISDNNEIRPLGTGLLEFNELTLDLDFSASFGYNDQIQLIEYTDDLVLLIANTSSDIKSVTVKVLPHAIFISASSELAEQNDIWDDYDNRPKSEPYTCAAIECMIRVLKEQMQLLPIDKGDPITILLSKELGENWVIQRV